MHDNTNVKTNPCKVLEEKWLRRQRSVQIKVLVLINKKVTKSESPGKFTSQNRKIKPNYYGSRNLYT